MGATTTEGTGPGAADNILPKSFNDVVKSDNLNLASSVLESEGLMLQKGHYLFDGASDTGLNIRSSQSSDHIYVYSYGSDGNGTGAGNIYVTENAVQLFSNWQNGGAGEKKWNFDANGRTTFPTSVAPTASIGAVGDTLGMVAFDSSFVYYCTGNYDGTTQIWKRAGLSTW